MNTMNMGNIIAAEKAALLHDASSGDMDAIKQVQSRSRSFSIGRDMQVFGEVPVKSYVEQGVTKTWAGDRDIWGDIDQAVRLQQPHTRVHDKKGSYGCGEIHPADSNIHLKVTIIILFIIILGHHLWVTTRGNREV